MCQNHVSWPSHNIHHTTPLPPMHTYLVYICSGNTTNNKHKKHIPQTTVSPIIPPISPPTTQEYFSIKTICAFLWHGPLSKTWSWLAPPQNSHCCRHPVIHLMTDAGNNDYSGRHITVSARDADRVGEGGGGAAVGWANITRMWGVVQQNSSSLEITWQSSLVFVECWSIIVTGYRRINGWRGPVFHQPENLGTSVKTLRLLWWCNSNQQSTVTTEATTTAWAGQWQQPPPLPLHPSLALLHWLALMSPWGERSFK